MIIIPNWSSICQVIINQANVYNCCHRENTWYIDNSRHNQCFNFDCYASTFESTSGPSLYPTFCLNALINDGSSFLTYLILLAIVLFGGQKQNKRRNSAVTSLTGKHRRL